MHIGILQAGHAPAEVVPARGDFDAMFRALLEGEGLSFTSWDVENMRFPASVRDAEGWLVTGSRHGAYEDHPFIPPLEAFIREAVDAGIRVVGICFGHQIVAQALGGKVAKHPGGWTLGRHEYRMRGGSRLALNSWHQDQVVALPEGAEVLGGSEACPYGVLAYGSRAFTIQAHPEFSAEVVGDYVALRRGSGTYPDALMERAGADAASGAPLDRARAGRAIAAFLREGRADALLESPEAGADAR